MWLPIGLKFNVKCNRKTFRGETTVQGKLKTRFADGSLLENMVKYICFIGRS